MRERTVPCKKCVWKVQKMNLCSRIQIVSYALLLALVQGHCGSKSSAEKSDKCGLIHCENSLSSFI